MHIGKRLNARRLQDSRFDRLEPGALCEVLEEWVWHVRLLRRKSIASGRSRQAGCGRKAARPIAAHQHTEAVVLDLVQPPGPRGRLGDWAGQAGLAEVGESYATQQHGL